MDLVNVCKIAGNYYVGDHEGNILIGYRQKKNAEAFALGHASFIYGEAEEYNRRFTNARAYLAARAARVYAPKAQLELF